MPSYTRWAAPVLLASTALARPQPETTGLSLPHQRRATSDNATASMSNITLSPITCGRKTSTALLPQGNITLNYGNNRDNSSSSSFSSSSSSSLIHSTTASGSDAVVNITLHTVHDGVLLEGIENLVLVNCSSDSVSLTFNDTDTLNAAYSSWSSYDELLLVTNHMGDCDTAFERGFFLSSSFETIVANMTLVAGTVRKNLTDVASYMRANFSGIPGPSSPSRASSTKKRDIVVDPSEVTVSADFDFGPVTLFEYEDSVSVIATTADVDVAVTLGGYLDFDIWTLSLETLYIDVDTAASADLALALTVTAAYNDTFAYDVGYEYYLLDVAGILTFGPEIALSVGADLDVAASVDLALALGADLANGTLHLDLLGDDTSSSGWDDVTYHANVSLTEQASVNELTPFLSVTVGIEFDILGGLLGLSSGLTPKIRFPTTVTLDAEQELSVGSGANGTLTITQPDSEGTCTNGVEVESEFEFTLDAFVTDYWSETLYSHSVEIADQCYSWV